MLRSEHILKGLGNQYYRATYKSICRRCRAAARIQKRLLCKRIKTGGVYLGFYTLRGRKFPYGNFRTSVFCEVKTQIVGETIVSRQSKVVRCFFLAFSYFPRIFRQNAQTGYAI